jgi:hypothetical protein
MNPKEKAKELVDKFTMVGLQQRNEGIVCALIAVDEILKAIDGMVSENGGYSIDEYYKEVKQEIQKLS